MKHSPRCLNIGTFFLAFRAPCLPWFHKSIMFRFIQPGVRAKFGVVVGTLSLTAWDVTKVTRAATCAGMSVWGVSIGGDASSFVNPSAGVMVNKFLVWLTVYPAELSVITARWCQNWYSIVWENVGHHDGGLWGYFEFTQCGRFTRWCRVYSSWRVCRHTNEPINQLVQKQIRVRVLKIREYTGASSMLGLGDNL